MKILLRLNKRIAGVRLPVLSIWKAGRVRAIKYACVVIFLFGLVACLTRTAFVSLLISLLVTACVCEAELACFAQAVVIGVVLAVLVQSPLSYGW